MSLRVYNPRRLAPKQRIDVLDRGRYLAAIVEAAPEFGWVLVKGMRGRDGVASVRVSAVRVTA